MASGNKKGWLLFGGAALLILLAKKAAYALDIKPGVTRSGRPEMAYAEQAVAEVWASWGLIPTVTSGTDSHSPGDLHTLGLAEDFRTNNIPDPGQKREMIQSVRDALEPAGYWLLFEDEGFQNEHLHIQFDPH